MRNFREYEVYKGALKLTSDIYHYTKDFPDFEKYGLSNQIQRAAVSIVSNIAEGSSRTSQIDFAHFLEISIGSAFEVETQIQIANNLGYLSENSKNELIQEISIVEKQLNQFISRLRQ